MGTHRHIREERLVTSNFMLIAFIVHFVLDMQINTQFKNRKIKKKTKKVILRENKVSLEDSNNK